MGRIKRAWFTTFNLDISFFEKYILSALTGNQYSELKTPYDYESINAQLTNDNEFSGDEAIEVKVFCDYRAEVSTGRPKQTVVQVYKLDIADMTGLNPEIKFSDGVFHPKLVLLETYSGAYWIMAGSANLTFGGWSTNRESFFCDQLLNTDNARAIGKFFTGITSKYREFKDHPLLNKLNSGKFGSELCKWSFLSSFQPFSLPAYLTNKVADSTLTIWSPYFGNDLPSVLEDLQEMGFSELTVIPAKTGSQKIRITPENYEKCNTINGVRFRQDRLPASAQESFVHAKVWLTPGLLAIGSWNLTQSGMNLSRHKNNNVEAGIVYSLTAREYKDLLAETPTSPLRSPAHFTRDELELEKEELLDKFTVVADLLIDWEKLEIQLQYPGYGKLINIISPDDYLKLPGIGRVRVAYLENGIDIRDYSKNLLNDRYFEIEEKNSGLLQYKGYLRESGLSSRPVNSFGNIDDFLKGWVSERPEDRTDWHRPSYKNEEEYGDDFSKHTREILLSTDQNAWFTSFHAFESITNRIMATMDMKSKERNTELKRIGRVLPGSLKELRNHLEELQTLYRSDKEQFKKSPVYLWFLVEKANYVFRLFNEHMRTPAEHIKKLRNLKIEEVLTRRQINMIGPEKLDRWMNFVISKLRML